MAQDMPEDANILNGVEMVRQFTETEKWDKPWFYNASPVAKLLFIYSCEHCDRAGFWKPNFKQAADTIGINIEMIEAAFDEIQHQFIRDGNWLWIPDFLYHQGNLPLYPEKNAHKGIIRLLRQHIDGFEGQIRKLLQHYHIPFEETLWHSDAMAMASSKVKVKYSKGKKGGVGGKLPGNPKDGVAKKFSKPTPEEVEAYGTTIGFAIDGHEFVDFYESKGWVVGKSRMKDWQAAVRTWKRRDEKDGVGKVSRSNQPAEQFIR